MCIDACHHAIAAEEHYWRVFAHREYSIVILSPLYDCAITLIYLLRHTSVHDLFTLTCQLIRRHIKDFAFASLLLQALLALASKLAVELPENLLNSLIGQRLLR